MIRSYVNEDFVEQKGEKQFEKEEERREDVTVMGRSEIGGERKEKEYTEDRRTASGMCGGLCSVY